MACAWVVLVAGFILLLTSTADGREATARLHIRQVSGERAFHGRVVSARESCVSGRRVTLHHEIPGPDPLVAKTRSRADGTWRAPVSRGEYRQATYYYARVAPKRVAGERCVGAKSAYAEAL